MDEELKPRIGLWYSMCCHQDLYQIENQETLGHVQFLIDGEWSVEIYATRLDGLLDNLESWTRSNNSSNNCESQIEECKQLIRDLFADQKSASK